MSIYEHDLRVRINADGTATVSGGAGGDWTVAETFAGWMASHPTQGNLHDLVNADYPACYDTRDEVLAHLLGPATVPV